MKLPSFIKKIICEKQGLTENVDSEYANIVVLQVRNFHHRRDVRIAEGYLKSMPEESKLMRARIETRTPSRKRRAS